MADQLHVSKKKKFVADGVFNAEVHELLAKFLNKAGYAGCVVKSHGNKIVIIAKVVNKKEALGHNGVRGNELEALIEKRFNFKKGHIEAKFEVIKNKNLSAAVQVELVKAKMLQGAPARSAANFIIRSVMRIQEVKGCEVVVSGKIRQQRAKTVKFKQGFLISTGHPKKEFIDQAIRHVFFKEGIMGIKVKIQLPTDFSGKLGGIPKYLPDKVTIMEPKQGQEEGQQEEGHREGGHREGGHREGRRAPREEGRFDRRERREDGRFPRSQQTEQAQGQAKVNAESKKDI